MINFILGDLIGLLISFLYKIIRRIPEVVETNAEAKITRKGIYDKSKIGIRFTKLNKLFRDDDKKRDEEL